MLSDYRYKLDSPRVTGHRQVKTTCPRCGRLKCFVRYVDTYDQCHYLSDEVGRCDHENSCGYHYKPSEYFADHPWLSEMNGQSSRVRVSKPKFLTTPPPKPLWTIPMEWVDKFHSTQSVFWQWFSTYCALRLKLDPEVVQRIYEDYRMGATQKGNVVFWQIDEQQRVRSGHIMKYNTNGHRSGYQDWVHSLLERQGRLPHGFNLQQCFFGQHLLQKYPDKHVCVVESEKTAIIMAACCPKQLWIATCGSSGLNVDKVECLRGRRFTLFPDSGCFAKWESIMKQTKGLQYNIDETMEQYPSNTDLADLILQPP